MSNVDELIANARRNEKIARNLFDIEVAIMNINRCGEFCANLIALVKDKFAINHVWLAITDTPSNAQLIAVLGAVDEQAPHYVKVPMVDFLQVSQSVREPVLINSDLRRIRTITPVSLLPQLKSVAVLPLVVDARVVGGLVLGAEEKDRYSPRKDSFFLQQLAVKASILLSGVWARERINFLATRDPLTLLRNRREMEESLDQELSRHARQREHLALMFIDCDDFKQVNDTYGHDVGDLYLKHVAAQLKELTRKSDLVFRFAGDEFVILLPNQRQEGADVIASRIKAHLLTTPLLHEGMRIDVRLSYGVISTEHTAPLDARALLKKADERLYQMKRLKSVSTLMEC
jgi:diguanylate cyclase (GGDEF)-like protein